MEHHVEETVPQINGGEGINVSQDVQEELLDTTTEPKYVLVDQPVCSSTLHLKDVNLDVLTIVQLDSV